jgi:hypothetical protein
MDNVLWMMFEIIKRGRAWADGFHGGDLAML